MTKRKLIYDKIICYIPENISNIQEYIKFANKKIYNIFNEKLNETNINMKVNIYYLIPDLNILKDNKCDSKKIKEIIYTIYDLNNNYGNDNDNGNKKDNIQYTYHILLDSMLYKMQQIQYIITNSFDISYDIPSYMLLAIYFDCSNILVENDIKLINKSLEDYSKKVNNSIGKIFLEKYNVYNMENMAPSTKENFVEFNNFLENVDIEYMEMIDLKIAADIYKVEEYLKRKYNIIKERMEIIGR